MKVLNCAGACGVDGVCQAYCLVEGDRAGFIALFELQKCVTDKCAECGSDQDCLQDCAIEKCTAEALVCQEA